MPSAARNNGTLGNRASDHELVEGELFKKAENLGITAHEIEELIRLYNPRNIENAYR